MKQKTRKPRGSLIALLAPCLALLPIVALLMHGISGRAEGRSLEIEVDLASRHHALVGRFARETLDPNISTEAIAKTADLIEATTAVLLDGGELHEYEHGSDLDIILPDIVPIVAIRPARSPKAAAALREFSIAFRKLQQVGPTIRSKISNGRDITGALNEFSNRAREALEPSHHVVAELKRHAEELYTRDVRAHLAAIAATIVLGLTLAVLARGRERQLIEGNVSRATAEAAARSRAVLDNVVDGIITIDQTGIVESFNRAAETIFGYEAAEVIGNNVSMLMPEFHHRRHDSYITAYLETGKASIIGVGREVEGKRRDGTLFPAELAVSETLLEDRRLFTGIVRDISARQRAARAMAEKSRELEATARFNRSESEIMAVFNRCEQLPTLLQEVLNILARHHEFRHCTAHVYDESTDLLELAASNSMPGSYRRDFELGQGPVGQVAANREPLSIRSSELQTEIGAVQAVDILVIPTAFQGQLLGVLTLAALRPFTPREREFIERVASQVAIALHNHKQYLQVVKLANELDATAREIAKKNRELERANRMKSEFLATMSHELRTPLNAIIGFSEMLRDGAVGPLDEQQADYAGEIFTSGHHLLSLINDILDLSKVEAGRMDLTVEDVDVAVVCYGALTIVKEKAASAGVRLSSQIDESIGSFRADGRKIRQILYNLLSNAVKFTPTGGDVRLECRSCPDRAGENIEFSVIDTGIGISERDRDKLFRPFSQLDSSAARSYEGTGLGLALVKQLTELHGGTIELASEVGKGSRFTVRIPRHALPSDESDHDHWTAVGEAGSQPSADLGVPGREMSGRETSGPEMVERGTAQGPGEEPTR
ncbi:MAG: ATP-binding protein [Proteobacteria bacterium]|nr:ATP-binding protein [Pseudomonadota bacterium]